MTVPSLSPPIRERNLGEPGRECTVAFDDLKTFRGQVYSGMSIGGTHTWEYPCGVWQEKKVAPDRWVFSFLSEKKRLRRAPEGSGAPAGTQYHWFILAHQRVKKLDHDTYIPTRPSWRASSTKSPTRGRTGGAGARNTQATHGSGRS
jgi:hypothetical protein